MNLKEQHCGLYSGKAFSVTTPSSYCDVDDDDDNDV